MTDELPPKIKALHQTIYDDLSSVMAVQVERLFPTVVLQGFECQTFTSLTGNPKYPAQGHRIQITVDIALTNDYADMIITDSPDREFVSSNPMYKAH